MQFPHRNLKGAYDQWRTTRKPCIREPEKVYPELLNSLHLNRTVIVEKGILSSLEEFLKQRKREQEEKYFEGMLFSARKMRNPFEEEGVRGAIQ